MLRGMRVALAQVNPTVGDLRGNRQLVEEAAAKAASEQADLVVLPEMVLTGYPPMDLLEREGFVRDQLRELETLAPASAQVAIALGAVLPAEGAGPQRLVNAAVLLAGGARRAVPRQDAASDLRRLRREALVPARFAARERDAARGRRGVRPDGLRRRLGTRAGVFHRPGGRIGRGPALAS